jgi:acyl-CoA-binding protein
MCTVTNLYIITGSMGDISIPKPSWYDVVGRAKWEAWSKLRGIQPEEV